MQPLWVICSSQVFSDVQPEIPKLYCVATVPCLHFLLVAGGGWTLWPWYCRPGILPLLPAGHPSDVKLLIAAPSCMLSCWLLLSARWSIRPAHIPQLLRETAVGGGVWSLDVLHYVLPLICIAISGEMHRYQVVKSDLPVASLCWLFLCPASI